MTLHELFSQLERPATPRYLPDRSLSAIAYRKHVSHVQRQLLWLVPLTAMVIAGLLWALQSTNVAMVQSGFVSYFSLLFSDFPTIVATWDSYALSLLESLPIDALIVFFAVLLSTIFCVRTLTRDIGMIVRPSLYATI